ncbi:MAG: GH92 family glycosyl hydrolase [Bacteroidales bacterium]|nr:GH92 family glycosyl hydrolase [Bacteroidales bacterium]
MKNLLFIGLIFAMAFPIFGQLNPDADLTKYVNPLIGTDSRFDLSNGNTYPAIALPWGMNFWTPQTNKMGDGWGYQYTGNKIRGFKQTHQPSPWINDYGVFSIFPTTEKLIFDENERESWFSHKAEISKPHYYKVYLADYNTSVEITPTERAACFRITYPETEKAFLIIDGFFKNSYVKVIPEERKIIGYARNAAGGIPDNFKNYFVIYIDKDFEEVFVVQEGVINPGQHEVESKHSGAIIRFKTRTNEQVHLKVASSFISPEQAELNLQREIGDDSFDQIRNKAKEAWNTNLNRIKVEGGTDAQFTIFYTALYRTMLFPRMFYEFDKNNKVIHYSPYNGKILEGYMFTDNGFWDTFRAVFPFFNVMFRDLNSKIMEGLANTYKESGWLPEWASPGHRNVMIGSNSATIIADAYLKGIEVSDINTLYEAIIKNSENEGPMHSVGRYGVDYYNDLGYIPYDVKINENTARTLEYAFADYTIWQLAKALKKPQSEIDIFSKRALNYKNVFDTSVNFMRGKNKDGTFQSPFRPDKWGDAFTEGCSWHWTWCVFHDVQGLIDLMGSNKNFTQKLDSVFYAPPSFDYSYYGFQIHEITEMLIVNMGQYAHGNQPIQHMPYLYNYAGEPWKSQYHVRNIMDKLYTPNPDGLCGDEDNGQTSAWYVFSAMGMYPVAPGTNQYVLGSPIFKKVTLQLENGNSFTINAANNASENIYIKKASLNKKKYTKNYLNHADIMKGGNITFDMSKTPNKNRGIQAEDFPYSMSNSMK